MAAVPSFTVGMTASSLILMVTSVEVLMSEAIFMLEGANPPSYR